MLDMGLRWLSSTEKYFLLTSHQTIHYKPCRFAEIVMSFLKQYLFSMNCELSGLSRISRISFYDMHNNAHI